MKRDYRLLSERQEFIAVKALYAVPFLPPALRLRFALAMISRAPQAAQSEKTMIPAAAVYDPLAAIERIPRVM